MSEPAKPKPSPEEREAIIAKVMEEWGLDHQYASWLVASSLCEPFGDLIEIP